MCLFLFAGVEVVQPRVCLFVFVRIRTWMDGERGLEMGDEIRDTVDQISL